MSIQAALPPAPAGVVQSLAELEALASLLACADPLAWDSVGRPSAQALAGIIRGQHAALCCEIGAHFKLPDTP